MTYHGWWQPSAVRRGAWPLLRFVVAAVAATSPVAAQDRGRGRDVVDSLAQARDSASSHRVDQTSPSESPPATSDDPVLEARTRAIAAQLRCPVCQGLSIQDSPSELAQEMKALVREQLVQGRSADEIKRYFVARYGEWILLQPDARGFNLAIYILPLLALVCGIAVVALLVRRWTAGRAVFAGDDGSAEESEHALEAARD